MPPKMLTDVTKRVVDSFPPPPPNLLTMAQVFDNGTEEMNHLNHLRDHLEKACADQTRTTTGETEQPSRRKQLVHSTAAQAPRAIACVEGRSDAPRVARVLHRSRCGMSCGRA